MLQINSENFETIVLQSEKPVVLDFYAVWCGPCRALHPLLEKLEKEHPEYLFAQLDIDTAPELVQIHRIMSVPTVKLFEKGEVKGSLIGASSEAELLELLQKAASV
ncbi:MAG: thioredoxin family protein [Candidatus Limivivens sp.]|nr:thioredoxin family protein [Candidatus Limivivens sp.]